jgi:hypothetical protein
MLRNAWKLIFKTLFKFIKIKEKMAEYFIKDGMGLVPEYARDIADSAFSELKWLDSEELTGVVIPNSVERIGNSAFFGCENLTSVELPKELKVIGEYAFYGCKGLTSIVIPDSVTEIGQGAFMCCDSLKTITLPASITKMGISQFFYCYALETIYVPKGMVDFYRKLLVDDTESFLGTLVPQILPLP